MATTIREQKIKAFETFYDTAEATFNRIGINDPAAKFYHDYYMLNLCPGSRAGGQEK